MNLSLKINDPKVYAHLDKYFTFNANHLYFNEPNSAIFKYQNSQTPHF